MKRIILIALVCSRLVFCLDAFSLQFDETAGFEKNDVESGISLSDSVTGVKVGFPVFDGRFYWNGDKYSYGVSLNSQSFMKSFPLQFKWGKLSSGGGFSKINNPLLSTSVSPFSLPSSSVNPITANLTSSFSKSDSLFFQAGYKKIAKLNFLFMPGENISVSTLVNVIFGKKINLSASFVYENYYYESKKSDSWYNDFVFYHNGNGNALYSQLSFSYGGVSTLFSCGVYESPFGNFKTIWKTENKIKIGKSQFGFSFLYNPSHNLQTPSKKVIDECIQGKISFQMQTKNGNKLPLFWKTGFTAFYQRNLTEISDEFKISTGLHFLCYLTSVSFSVQTDFSLTETETIGIDFLKGTASVNNKWYFSVVQPSLKISFSAVPKNNYTEWQMNEIISLSFDFSENPAVSVQAGASFGSGIEMDFSASLKFAWKFIKCNAKIELKIDVPEN